MTDNEKLNKIREKLSDICHRINEEKETDYQNINPQEKKFFCECFDLAKAYDKDLTSKLFDAMTSPTETMMMRAKEIEKTFNLKNYLKSEYKKIVGNYVDFEKRIEQEDIRYVPKVENLYNSYSFLDDKEAAGYKKQAKDVLDKLVGGKDKANLILKEKIQNIDISFAIYSGKEMDGKCLYNEKDKKLQIAISQGSFETHKDALGMLISHELGHFIDVAGRPKGYQGMLGQGQEYFADAIGYKMAKSSGFDIEYFKSENRKLGGVFADRMEKLEKLQLFDAKMMQQKQKYER